LPFYRGRGGSVRATVVFYVDSVLLVESASTIQQPAADAEFQKQLPSRPLEEDE